jgi:hypothetical protein
VLLKEIFVLLRLLGIVQSDCVNSVLKTPTLVKPSFLISIKYSKGLSASRQPFATLLVFAVEWVVNSILLQQQKVLFSILQPYIVPNSKSNNSNEGSPKGGPIKYLLFSVVKELPTCRFMRFSMSKAPLQDSP